MEQALFSAEPMKDHGPQSIRTVALCRSGDLRLQPLCERYGIEVVIDPMVAAEDAMC